MAVEFTVSVIHENGTKKLHSKNSSEWEAINAAKAGLPGVLYRLEITDNCDLIDRIYFRDGKNVNGK